MNLFSHIADKPKSYRNKLSFSAAAVATSFVFVVWFSTLDERIARKGGELSADNRETSSVAAVPFASGELTKQFDTIQGTLDLLRGNTENPGLEAESFDEGEQTLVPEDPFY